MEATYIVYDKERILTVGTAKEIAEYLGIGITSVYTLSSDLKRGVINPKIKSIVLEDMKWILNL